MAEFNPQYVQSAMVNARSRYRDKVMELARELHSKDPDTKKIHRLTVHADENAHTFNVLNECLHQVASEIRAAQEKIRMKTGATDAAAAETKEEFDQRKHEMVERKKMENGA